MIAVAMRSRWFLREAQLILLLAVEASWIFAWSVILGGVMPLKGPSPVLGLPSIAGLLLLAAVLTRLAITREKTSKAVRGAVAVLGLAFAVAAGASGLWAMYWAGDTTVGNQLIQTNLGLRDGAAVALSLAAWWRGINAGRSRLTLDDVESGFRVGIASTAMALVLSALVSLGAATEGKLVEAVVVVLFAGLTGLPLARIGDLGRSSRHQGTAPLGVRGHWLAIFLTTVALLLLLTFLIAQVLTFHRIDALLSILAGPFDALLWAIVYVIAVPVGLLIEGLVYLFRLLLQPRAQARPPQPPNLNWIQTLRAQGERGAAPPAALILALKLMLAAVIVTFVLWLLARAVSRFATWGAEDEVEESRDFVWSWAMLGDEIRRLLQYLLGWRRPRLQPAQRQTQAPIATVGGAWGPREIYREFLRFGSQRGRARTPTETPREYERALSDVPPFRDGIPDVELLTDTYVRARYGSEPPEQETIAEARRALERLRDHDG